MVPVWSVTHSQTKPSYALHRRTRTDSTNDKQATQSATPRLPLCLTQPIAQGHHSAQQSPALATHALWPASSLQCGAAARDASTPPVLKSLSASLSSQAYPLLPHLNHVAATSSPLARRPARRRRLWLSRLSRPPWLRLQASPAPRAQPRRQQEDGYISSRPGCRRSSWRASQCPSRSAPTVPHTSPSS